jgi:hypothetical protein
LIAELGEPYRELWTLLGKTHGEKQAARILAGVLGAITDHGESTVTAVIEKTLRSGAFTAGNSGNLLMLTHYMPKQPVLDDTVVPTALRCVQVESGRASDYDILLAEGGAQ